MPCPCIPGQELLRETMEDMRLCGEIFRREVAIYRKYGLFDRLGRVRARTVAITEAGHFFKVFDSVKITDPGHKYAGHTGVVTRIDDNKVRRALLDPRPHPPPPPTRGRGTTASPTRRHPCH